MAEWKDATSYSQNDKERKPRVWRITIAHMNITIVNGHLHYPGEWVMTAEPFYNLHKIGSSSDNVEHIKVKAINLVRNRVNNLKLEFDKLVEI